MTPAFIKELEEKEQAKEEEYKAMGGMYNSYEDL